MGNVRRGRERGKERDMNISISLLERRRREGGEEGRRGREEREERVCV